MANRARSGRSAAPRGRGLRRVLAAGILGVLTAAGFGMTLGAAHPLDGAGGVVALDGDHLQPWLLRLEHWSGERVVFFEKGRVYSRPGVGPAGASSAAVSCWSFATRTRQNPVFRRGEVPMSERVRRAVGEGGRAWGIAEDRRGWPWPAMQSRIVGTMRSPSAAVDAVSVYEVEGGIPYNFDTNTAGSRSLVSARAVPLTPLWGGLAADAAVFGAVWWGLIVGLRSVSASSRAAARVRRGRCPGCAYDLRHELDGGCPECGWNRAADVKAPGDQTRSRA